MREIKFRAWDNKGKCMVNWLTMCQTAFNSGGDGLMYEILAGERLDCTPMQFTGLLDKNGVEIYEGDIVDAGNLVCEVAWKGVGWVATWTDIRRGRNSSLKGSPELGFREHAVIGNIHQNPELLESQP